MNINCFNGSEKNITEVIMLYRPSLYLQGLRTYQSCLNGFCWVIHRHFQAFEQSKNVFDGLWERLKNDILHKYTLHKLLSIGMRKSAANNNSLRTIGLNLNFFLNHSIVYGSWLGAPSLLMASD